MTGIHADLQAARSAFDQQEAWRLEDRSCGEKPFGRWAWWAEQRGGLRQMPRPSSWWEASASQRLAMGSSSQQSMQWQYVAPKSVPTHGGAGRINQVRVDPHNEQHWYACAPAGGLWHSWDEGQTWEVAGIDVLSPLGVTDVWIDPQDANHLWVATGDGNGGDTYSIGVLESTDGGTTWMPLELAFGVDQGRTIHALRHHPTLDLAFVGTDLGLFRTTDGGASFDLVLSGLTRDVVWVNDSTVVAGIQNVGVFRSTDLGESWTPCVLPETNGSMGRIQLAGQAMQNGSCDTLYAVAGHYFQQNFLAFWRSVDAGVTWTAEATRDSGPNLLGYTISGADSGGQAFWDLCIAVDPQDANRVLVGGVNLWETPDGGATWTCPVHWQGAFEAKYAHADQHGILILEDGRVILSNDGGVFLWENDAVADLSEGLEIMQGYALGVHPTVAGDLLVGSQDNGTTLTRSNSESRILDGDGFHAFFDPSTDGRLYASAYYGLLYRSDDGGRTMNNIASYFQSSGPNEVGAWQTPFQLHPSVPGRIVAAKKSLHFSDDGGESWTTWGGMGTVRSNAMALTALDDQAALVAKNSLLYWRDGESMSFNVIEGLPEAQIGDVAIDVSDIETWWVCFSEYEPDMQVWRTNDQGASWQNVSGGLPQLPVHALVQLDNGQWICGSELGVHIWDESSMAWSLLGEGLPLTPVVDLALDQALNRIVVSTYGRGLWSCPMPTAPDVAGGILDMGASPTQCMGMLSGQPTFQNSGLASMDGVHYVIQALQGEWMLEDTLWTAFTAPLANGESALLQSFHLDVPNAGAWEVTVEPWSLELGVLGPGVSATLHASGLGHVTNLMWWGDCENVDMRWELRNSDTQEVLVQSLPLAPADTIHATFCLTEGCYDLVWSDEGGDGFSGAYCGEPGGYALLGPFEETISDAQGLDFGDELVVPFCVAVPWCYADFNGDGTRSVDDLLTMLSDFGCPTGCFTDTDFDDSVGVSDLMNMLSVFGQGCSLD